MLARVALMLGATVAALLALEVGLRLLGVETASYHSIAGFTVYDPELGWRLAPERSTTFEGAHFSVRVRHNAEGLRDRSYPYERAPGRRRILVLGDSSVWCWGVEIDDCFTERLETRLPNVDVINAGVPGYSTAQELLFFEREGRRYRPDLVILLMSPNDVTDNVDPDGPRFRLEDDGALVLTNVPVPRRKSLLTQWLQERSRLFAHVAYLAAVVERGSRERETGFTRPAHERTDAPLTPSDAPAAQTNRPTTASIADAATTDVRATGAPADTPAPADASLTNGEAWMLTAAILRRLAASVRESGATLLVVSPIDFEPMRSWVRDVCGRHGIAYLDVVPALWSAGRPEKLRLRGDPHFNPAGQEVLARAIRATIE